MTFGLYVQKEMEVIHILKEKIFPLLTHSQTVIGNLVETCGPYPRDYMSETHMNLFTL